LPTFHWEGKTVFVIYQFPSQAERPVCPPFSERPPLLQSGPSGFFSNVPSSSGDRRTRSSYPSIVTAPLSTHMYHIQKSALGGLITDLSRIFPESVISPLCQLFCSQPPLEQCCYSCGPFPSPSEAPYIADTNRKKPTGFITLPLPCPPSTPPLLRNTLEPDDPVSPFL